MRHIYTSLDIGTDSIKVLVCELYKNKLNLLAASSYKSEGIKKGLIIDGAKAASSIRGAINDVEKMLNIKINKVIVTVPSYSSEYQMIKTDVDVIDSNGNVTNEDIANIYRKIEKLELDDILLNILPIDYCTEQSVYTKDAKTLVGKKLYNRSIIVTVPKKNIYSVSTLLEQMGIEIIDVSTNGIGDMYALKTKENSSKLGSIINIGSDTTSISIYNKGIIVKNSIIGLGGKSIDNDLAYMYKINMGEAKKIKEKFALAHKKYASVNDLYDIILEDGKSLKVNQYEVSEIVMSRVEEILMLAKKELVAMTDKKMEYILLTGGTSNMEHLEYVLDDIFGNNASIGKINLIGVRINKYSSALGNIIYYINKQNTKGIKNTMIDEVDEINLSSTKKDLVISTETMLGKVFEHFFGE